MLFALLLAACGGENIPPAATPTATLAPTPTPTPTPSPTPIDLGPPEPELARIIEHIRVLSDEIGTRVAGSPQEDAVVAYASSLFESWGYNVEVQEFTSEGASTRRHATLTIETPERQELIVVSFFGSPAGEVRGLLFDAGTGQPEDFPDDATGMIALIQRDDVRFTDMATHALDAGALAIVIANKEPGRFPGVLDPPLDIITASITQEDGEMLRGRLAAGQVEVTLNVRDSVTGRNVIARPESGACRTLTGGHADSVPWSPGANDNASGTALVLELARAAAVAELAGHCFVLWGGEEGGLQGSRYMVSLLTEAEIEMLEGVYNYDAAAGPGAPQLIGGTALANRAKELAEGLGGSATITVLPDNAGSDHVAFLEKGIAALMLTAPNAGTLHTPNDTFENLITTSLQPIADLGFAILQALDSP